MRYVRAIGLLALLSWSTAQANVIQVMSPSGGSSDGTGCTLHDAIKAANTDLAVGECAAGSGDDVINITSAAPITFSEAGDSVYRSALPVIKSNLSINGNGVVLRRDPALGACMTDGVADTGDFGFVRVEAPGTVGLSPAGGVAFSGMKIQGFCRDGDYVLGGAIQNYATLTLANVEVTDNMSHNGGGAVVNFATLRLSGVLLKGNRASQNGGAVFNYQNATLYVDGSAFVDNVAERLGGSFSNGGAISSSTNASVEVVNSTFSGNRASSGAAIYMNAGPLHAGFSTFVDNAVDNPGDAVVRGYQSDMTFSSVLMGRVIGGGVNCQTSAVALLHALGSNLAIDTSCPGFTLTGIDPGLTSLLVLGGLPVYALKSGSPAVDAAADCKDAQGRVVLQDQRHALRPALAACDLGAFELQDGIFANGFD